MTDAGFFRGTSAEQDYRFADKQKKLLKELNFSPILNTKLNVSKIELDNAKPWIDQKIKEILEKDDEILSDSIFEFFKEKEPDGKALLVLISGFVEESKSAKFVEELWTKLIAIQDSRNGISPKLASSPGNGVDNEPPADPNADSQKDVSKLDDPSAGDRHALSDRKRESRSRTRTPPPRNSSPRRSGSHSGSPHSKKSNSKSGSKSGSRSPSRSRSKSGSRSGSHSRSRSKSSSRSPRRSRSPMHRPTRFRRSRSRSRSRSGSYRRRSRSPRTRRGYGRFAYRGFNYDRRGRGVVGPPRRRVSPPWSRRRYSPGSPEIRRRRTPSPMSPRRRSRSPYYRRRSRSRSPPPYGHMAGRRSPRPPVYGPRPDLAPRPMPPHRVVHRPILPGRTAHVGLPEHRGYSDALILPRHSTSNMMMSRQHDLPLISHGPPGPSVPHRSPSRSSSGRSGRKKHKKDKKHRKHKKSKRHRSSTPEKRKKHKKHKKTKKHKS